MLHTLLVSRGTCMQRVYQPFRSQHESGHVQIQPGASYYDADNELQALAFALSGHSIICIRVLFYAHAYTSSRDLQVELGRPESKVGTVICTAAGHLYAGLWAALFLFCGFSIFAVRVRRGYTSHRH